MIINDLYNNKKSNLSEGMKADELSRYCEKLVAEKGWDAAYKHAQFMAAGATDPAWGSVLKYLHAMKDGINEAHDTAAKEIFGNLFHNSIPPGAEKHHVSAVLKAHGLKDTDAKHVLDRVRKMGYTGSRLDKSETDEGRMVKGPGGVPLDRQGRPVPPKVKPIRMQKWLVTHSGSHGEGGKDIIEAPNFETAWEIANEYDLDIIDVKPYRGPAGPTLVDEGVAEGSYDNDPGIKHTRGSLLAKLEALPRGSDDFEWNRQRAIQHLKQGNMIRAKYYMMLMKRGEPGVAEGWDPDTTRLEQDVRDALENGDDYTAKQYAKMAPTPEAKKYLLNIIKQAMYIDDLGGETNWKGVAEGSELKQAKRKYNQAAKDANLDQVGAGKKIDTMKKSLRQKDVAKQGVAEGNPVPGQNFTTAQGQQMNWNPTTKSWASTGPAVPGDGFDVVSNTADMRTTDTGSKPNSTYTSTTVQKNPTTGQQKSLSSWDHTDPATGKRYVGSTYTDPQGNAQTQKNYQESKKTKVDEVSLGDYRKKAAVSQASAKIDRFFGRDDPAKVARADQTIAKREKGLGRADSRIKPYTAPPVDQDKQRRDLADKYPNIDELVRQAELNRDPNYEYADGQAYYNGRDAEHKYHKLKQIQRMIRGTELDEMDFGSDDAEVDHTEIDGINTVAYDKSGKAISSTTPDLFGTGNQKTDLRTGDVTTNAIQGPYSVSQTTTPGGYTKQSTRQFKVGPATATVSDVGPNIAAGQLAGTTTSTANVDWNGQSKQQVKGVGFGGASGPNVGKNYVGASDEELAKHLATGLTGVELNENINRMKHLAGIKSTR